jgi:hypothetical protein
MPNMAKITTLLNARFDILAMFATYRIEFCSRKKPGTSRVFVETKASFVT